MRIRATLLTAALALALAAPAGALSAGDPVGGTSAAPGYTAALPFLTVPAETEARVVLLSGIHTKLAEVNDRVEGEVVQPVYVDGRLALPQGTLLFGRITHVRAAGRMHRPAEVGFRFDQVSLPDGEIEPVAARLAALENPGQFRIDPEGTLKATRPSTWKYLTGGLVGTGGLMIVPKVAGATAAATAGSLATAGLLGYYAFVPRGPEVHLPPDTACRVRFDYAFSVHGQS
ncbi:MAG TPA: hypothetical protein VL523_12125 [Terriglobia bacterium]|nr:hypothetical protein [Terriglobia bacterium]